MKTFNLLTFSSESVGQNLKLAWVFKVDLTMFYNKGICTASLKLGKILSNVLSKSIFKLALQCIFKIPT